MADKSTRRKNEMVKILKYLLVSQMFLCGGCNILGLLVSPTWHDEKIPAEFELKKRASEGIVIFIDIPARESVGSSFKDELADSVGAYLIKRAGVNKKYIVSKEQLALLEESEADFARLLPSDIGKKLGVGLVLYVRVESFNLYDIAGRQYYEGSLVTRSILFDSVNDSVLWPVDTNGKVVRTVVDIETKGADVARAKLIASNSHCIVRNFYDCPRDEYKTAGEQSDYDFDSQTWPFVEGELPGK